eukprot:51504-Eustigmatos_ZCMA.PRE.1
MSDNTQYDDSEVEYETDAEVEETPVKAKKELTEKQRAAWIRLQEGRMRKLQQIREEKARKLAETKEEKAVKRKLGREITNQYSVDQLEEMKTPVAIKNTTPAEPEEPTL